MTHFNYFGFNFQYANKTCNAFQEIIRGELNGRYPEDEHHFPRTTEFVLNTISDLIVIGEAKHWCLKLLVTSVCHGQVPVKVVYSGKLQKLQDFETKLKSHESKLKCKKDFECVCVCYSQPRCGWDAQQRWVLWQKPDDRLQKHSIHMCTWVGRSQCSAKANWWCGNRKETCHAAGCSTWWTGRHTEKDRNIHPSVKFRQFTGKSKQIEFKSDQTFYKSTLIVKTKFIIRGL